MLLFSVLYFLSSCKASIGQNLSTDFSTETSSSALAQSENGFDYEVESDSVKIIKYQNNDLHVVIPEQIAGKAVKIIGESSFYQHRETVSIMLPKGLTTIENSAFYRCYSLAEITIPKSVNQIDSNPFFRCSSMIKISVDPENAYYSDINGVLFNKDKTELIAYPEGNTSEYYTIPDTVKKIATDAFGYRSAHLKRLTILSTVTLFPDYNIFIYPDDITLKVESGSAAERYAKEHELKFEIIK
jgi:hypothetical protein